MPLNSEEARAQKPIRSAEAVAALRAASTRERCPSLRNPDYLAQAFVGGGLYRSMLALPAVVCRRLIEIVSPGSYCYFLARTHFIDEHLVAALDRGVRQIVILGAGYDSRAIRLSDRLAEATVYEVDLRATQDAKRGRLHDRGIPTPSSVRYLAHDFHQGSLVSVLQAAGLKLEEPVFFIWEGVTYYLDECAVADVFQTAVRRCSVGTSIAFDYSLQSFVAGDKSTYGGPAMQRWLARHNERFRFGLEVGALDRYVAAFGLSVIEDIGPEDLRVRYLTDTRGRSLGQPLGHLRMACAILQ